jgi:beta-lactamase class A
MGQWLTVTLMVVSALFLIYKLYQYSGSRGFYPTGLTIAAVPVSRMTADEASEVLNNVYLEAPIVLHYREESFEIPPTSAEFVLDLPTMLSQADDQRTQQDFWAGFWGFLWGRRMEVDIVPISATHNRDALIAELNRISSIVDQPAQPAQPVPGTLSFQRGASGVQIDIGESLDDVELALYRPNNREAHLVVRPVDPERPDINLLTRLLVNHLQEFEQETGGVASIFILDLETGEEASINADVVMSGMDLMRIPIALEVYRALERPTLVQEELISATLAVQPDNVSANSLLNIIAGEENAHLGTEIVTESMQRLGLLNTFMLTPYDGQLLAGTRPPATPANSVEVLRTRPNPNKQTTAEDIGLLLSMIYYCAQGQGGTLLAAYAEQLTQGECQELLTYMSQNKIGSLIEEGVPRETAVAHRHAWISDTHGDAGIVFSPGGDYVIVQILYQPDWLEWAVSSPLLAEISRAAYNFFNFDNPYLSESSAN